MLTTIVALDHLGDAMVMPETHLIFKLFPFLRFLPGSYGRMYRQLMDHKRKLRDFIFTENTVGYIPAGTGRRNDIASTSFQRHIPAGVYCVSESICSMAYLLVLHVRVAHSGPGSQSFLNLKTTLNLRSKN